MIDGMEELRSSTDSLASEIQESIRARYMGGDERPWIIGLSGGKDSTLLTQLVVEAIQRVPPARRKRHVYVISSDTQVETPYIASFVRDTHELINNAGRSLGLPLTAHMVYPDANDTFWVKVIGYGYPPPSRFMRWCTDRLKIKPADRFIREKLSEHGEVILLLGTRYEESQDRAESLRRHERDDGFHSHSSLTKAWVWAPIRFLTTEQVWAYLVFHPSPWGGDNIALRDLYKNANAGECPLVVDDTTEPCGNSRFGCYTCTVVDRDKSLEGFIAVGQDEYRELLDLRNWLVELRDDPAYRTDVRRNGQPGIGPLRMEVRHQVLERLLGIQERLGEELISTLEIALIKRIWISDTLVDEKDQPDDLLVQTDAGVLASEKSNGLHS